MPQTNKIHLIVLWQLMDELSTGGATNRIRRQAKDWAALTPLGFANELAERMGRRPAVNWQITRR